MSDAELEKVSEMLKRSEQMDRDDIRTEDFENVAVANDEEEKKLDDAQVSIPDEDQVTIERD